MFYDKKKNELFNDIVFSGLDIALYLHGQNYLIPNQWLKEGLCIIDQRQTWRLAFDENYNYPTTLSYLQ